MPRQTKKEKTSDASFHYNESGIAQLTFIFTQEAQSSVQVFTISARFLGSVFEIEAPTNMPLTYIPSSDSFLLVLNAI